MYFLGMPSTGMYDQERGGICSQKSDAERIEGEQGPGSANRKACRTNDDAQVFADFIYQRI